LNKLRKEKEMITISILFFIIGVNAGIIAGQIISVKAKKL